MSATAYTERVATDETPELLSEPLSASDSESPKKWTWLKIGVGMLGVVCLTVAATAFVVNAVTGGSGEKEEETDRSLYDSEPKVPSLRGQSAQPPPLSEAFGLYDSLLGGSDAQDPCASYEDGDMICAKGGSAILCKKKFGKMSSWKQETCSKGCDANTGKCASSEDRSLYFAPKASSGQASQPPPLFEAVGLYEPLYEGLAGKSQDPCALYQDGDMICVKGASTLCKNKFGKVRSSSQKDCLNGVVGCDGITGKCKGQ